ncbi:pol_fenv1 ame: full=pol polyprotein contains:, partial [Lynx pardinus]
MSNAQMVHYQGLLLNPLCITYTSPRTLNPASLLPDPDLDSPLHDCANILAQIHGIREDLQDRPLPDAEVTWFMDGTSFVHQGQRYAGAAVTSETEVIWAEALPPGTSAQRAELIALTQALKMGRDRKVTVYTDSRYAFATAHIHGAIYRERRLLTAEGKDIKNRDEILALLVAIWAPKKLAIVHFPGHQKITDPISRGNNLADQTARQRVHEAVWPKLRELYETGPPSTPHQYRPGDWVLVKRHRQENLEPRWKGPYQIILTTPTAIKVDNIPTWIHHTHVKPADPLSDLVGHTDKKTAWTVDWRRGGLQRHYTQTQDCGTTIAYLTQTYGSTGFEKQQWLCVNKPEPLPPMTECPCKTFQESIHSSCYDSYQQCIGPDNTTTYFTAILQSTRAAIASDDNKQILAGCRGSVGAAVCWNPRAPIHVHSPYELDPQTMSILETTFSPLNTSNPILAQDCWLCLPQQAPRPIAIPTIVNISITNDCFPSSLPEPFPIQFISPFNASCFTGNLTSQDNSIDVGITSLAQCHQYITISSSLCSTNTTVFVCGNNLAYTYLPHNWTGICVLATLLPDIDLVAGKTPMPIPSLDFVTGRSKGAVAVIPLLAGLGIT